ncbi:MAG: hypothetical protein RIS85_42, partial [Pseudomonadota bacterium]
MGALGTWFGGLTGRERALVGIAGGITALVVLVYGIVLPLGGALDEAATRHRIATERAGRIAAQLQMLKATPPAPRTALG